MVGKVMITQKMNNIKSTVSEKKEDDKINEMKKLNKDKRNDMQDKVGKWRKLAPKLFVWHTKFI